MSPSLLAIFFRTIEKSKTKIFTHILISKYSSVSGINDITLQNRLMNSYNRKVRSYINIVKNQDFIGVLTVTSGAFGTPYSAPSCSAISRRILKSCCIP